MIPGRFQAKAVGGANPQFIYSNKIIALRNEYYTYEIQAMVREQEFLRRHAAVSRLALELEQLYDRLMRDDEVVSALGELNKTADHKLTIGPRENYKQNLAKITEQLLKKEGVYKGLNGKFQFSMVAVVAINTKKAEKELRKALETQTGRQSDMDKRKRMFDGAVQQKKADRIAALRDDNAKAEEKLKEIDLDVATKREVYVQRVAALRKVVDESRQKVPGLEKQNQVSIGRINPEIDLYLKDLEKTIVTKEVVLKPDKTIYWVNAILNGKPSDMVLEPTVDVIRMSAESAAKLGIKDGAGTPEKITFNDGKKLDARRVTLASVQVGTCTAKDVECLVIPEGFESKPVLGTSFLNRFSFRFDPDAGKITLTQVNLPKLK